MAELPEPIDTGNAGTQLPAPASSLAPIDVSPVLPASVANTVQALVVDQPRALGNLATAQIVGTHLLVQERREMAALDDLRNTREQLDAAKTTLATVSAENAVLRSQVGSEERFSKLRMLLTAAGGVLIAVGVDLYKSGPPHENLGLALGFAGLVLSLVSSGVRITGKGTGT